MCFFLDNYLNNNENVNFPQQIIQKDYDKASSLYSHVLDLEIPKPLLIIKIEKF